jgi:hypothetical protein
MRRILGLTVFVLYAAVAGFAFDDDDDDHDDRGPAQVGYAVVTPTGGSATGLQAFTTFGLRGNHGGVSQAGMLPTSLTTSALIFVESSERIAKNLGVAIVNPNSGDLTVAMTLRKSDGTQLGTATLPVPSHQQVSRFVTQLFPILADRTDFIGSVTLSSPQPVSIAALRFRSTDFSTLPVVNLSTATNAMPVIAAGVGGPGSILFPQFVAGGGWATEIVIANTGTASLTVRVDLFKSDGKPLTTALNHITGSSFTNLTIPAGGVLALAPRNRQGDDDF